MKLLTREELKGIDSSSKTIEKWDEFLKKAVYNLGYTQELIDNMLSTDTKFINKLSKEDIMGLFE